MVFVHNYKDGSFCVSNTFEQKVDNDNYIIIEDEDYYDIIKGKKLLNADNTIVDNPDYVEPSEED